MRTDKKQTIIETIKSHYSRDLRKGLVRSLLDAERSNDEEELKGSYTLMNRIFSYVLKELEWTIASDNETWDDTPLEILKTCFPRIEESRWYRLQSFVPNARKIEVRRNDVASDA